MGKTKKKIIIVGAVISILIFFCTVGSYLPLLENYPTKVNVVMNQSNNGNLFLIVGNNSPNESLVDIAVYIDDKLALKGNFKKGDILPFIANYNDFQFSLSNGTHKFYVESLVGRAQLEEKLEINGTTRVLISYEYDPKNNEPDRHFNIGKLEKWMIFE